jgi:hypothetical protein
MPACIFSVEVEGSEKHDMPALSGPMVRVRQPGADAGSWMDHA